MIPDFQSGLLYLLAHIVYRLFIGIYNKNSLLNDFEQKLVILYYTIILHVDEMCEVS